MDANGRRERAIPERFAGFLLVGALLLQTFTPHFHDVAPLSQREVVVAARTADASVPDAVTSPECLACRTAQQIRLGIVVSTASPLAASPDVAMRADGDLRAAALELLLALAPPRAPPV